MRPQTEHGAARRLSASGWTDAKVARVLGIPRETVRDWRRAARAGELRESGKDRGCPVCCPERRLDGSAYAYLLGLYLGDGWLSKHPRNVFRLRISLDARQPLIIDECERAVAAVRPDSRVSRQQGDGCTVIGSYWKHWRCLFPQHGPGRKHRRHIELTQWQSEIARAFAGRLLRGLIHADGCRVSNRVGRYVYPRYFFSNLSLDIQRIFCRACEDLGVSWTRPSFKHISVARAEDVAELDVIIGPKR